MIALLNQFSLPEVILGGCMIVALNTFLLKWAMSRLQADPRDNPDSTSTSSHTGRAPEALGEPVLSTVASPRARRLQPGSAAGGRSESTEGVETVVPGAGKTFAAAMAGAAARPGEPREAKMFPEAGVPLPMAASATPPGKGKVAVGKEAPLQVGRSGGGSGPIPPPATPGKPPEPAGKPVGLPAFASIVSAGAKPPAGKTPEPVGARADLIATDKPKGPTLPPLGGVGAGTDKSLPGADLIVPKPGRADPVDVKKPKDFKADVAKEVPSGGLIAVGATGAAAEAKSPPVTPTVPAEKKPEPAASGSIADKGAAITPPVPPAPAAPAAPELPTKSFWRPRIFLPTKLPETKPGVPVEGKSGAKELPVAPAAPAVPAATKEEGKPASIVTPAPTIPPAPAPVVSEPVPADVPAPVTPPPTDVVPPVSVPPVEKLDLQPAAAKPSTAPADKKEATPSTDAKPETLAAPSTPQAEVPAPVAPAKPEITPVLPIPAPLPLPAAGPKPADLPVTPARPPAAAPIPPIPAVPPAPAFPLRGSPSPGAITRADVPPLVPVAPYRPEPTKPTQPVMSNESTTPATSESKASAQLTLGFEITSLQLTPFFKLGSVQLRPLSDIVSLHLVASEQADGPMAAGISFQIEKVELNDKSQVGSILLKPLGAAQPATIPQPKLQIDAIKLNQAAEGSPIEITPSQQTSTAVQFLATFTIASMEFTPAFEIGSLRLEPTSQTVSLRLAPSQRGSGMQLPPTFEMSNVQVGPEAQLTAVTLTPSAPPEPAAGK